MFSTIKLNIGNYILQREVNELNNTTKLISLSKIKKLAILFDADSNKDITYVKSVVKYFLDKNIDVNVLGFVNKTNMNDSHLSTLYINYFNLKDTSFFGVPESKKTRSFLSQDYDLLVNLSLINSFPTKYLSLKSKSKFRIGVFSENNDLNYDLMFKLKVNTLEYFIDNLKFYLELIDKNHEK